MTRIDFLLPILRMKTLLVCVGMLTPAAVSLLSLHAQNRDDIVEALSWSPDGTQYAIGGGSSGCSEDPIDEYGVRIVDASTGQRLDTFLGHRCRLIDVAWSPDGSKLVSSSFDGLMFVWDAASGGIISTADIFVEIGGSVIWSPDSSMIASVFEGGKSAVVWDALSGDVLRYLPEHDDFTTSVAWSPDNEGIATSGLDNTINIWRVTTGEKLNSLVYADLIYWVDWSPDGAEIASASRDGTIDVRDSVSGQPRLVVQAHEQAVEIVKWSSDGTMLASSSADGMIGIWDAVSGMELESLDSPVGRIHDIEWKPDSSLVSVLGEDTGANGGLPIEIPVLQSTSADTEP